MAIIIDGKKYAEKVIEELRSETAELTVKPKLVVICVGDNPASKIYVGNKNKKALYIGYDSHTLNFPENVSEEELLNEIYKNNNDKSVHAIMVQLPLPEHLNVRNITEAVLPEKDADGFTSVNFGKLLTDGNPYSVPCTPQGIMNLLDEYSLNLSGKNVVIIGRSDIVGKPLAILMLKKNATVTVAHSKTENLPEIVKNADVVVAAAGKAGLVKGDFVKKGAVVIDVGINRTEQGISGDVDFESVVNKASYITPVPGGIGPVTVAMLMKNTMILYKKQLGL